MNRCPITFQECGEKRYSSHGLRSLSPRLSDLRDFPYSAEQQRIEAVLRASKMSVQGMQPKLSAKLAVKSGTFRITDRGGKFLIKPQHNVFPRLPENETLTMRLAREAGIEVPTQGAMYCEDGSLSYFVRRFDRVGHAGKLAVEDFAQLSGKSRETKYDSSMERVAAVIDEFCTFPAVEKEKLLRRCLFNFLVGNEDMHLKNFSLITRNGKVELAPAYDFLSTTCAYLSMGKAIREIEETALPLGGKKRTLTAALWLDYYGCERLDIRRMAIDEIMHSFESAIPTWMELLDACFLTKAEKGIYADLIRARWKRLSGENTAT